MFKYLLLTLALATPAYAQLQDGSVLQPATVYVVSGGGGGSFTGGDLTSPLGLDPTNTLCSQALALRWTNDLDTGLQRAAANTLDLCLAGVSSLHISDTAMLVSVESTIQHDFNGSQYLTIANENQIGSSSDASLYLSSGGTQSQYLHMFNSGASFTTDGLVVAKQAVFELNGGDIGGMLFDTLDTSAAIKFAVGSRAVGNLKLTIGSTTITSGVPVIVNQDQNGNTYAEVLNQTSGASAQASFYLSASANGGGDGKYWGHNTTSHAFSTTGLLAADMAASVADSGLSGGMLLSTIASAPIKFSTAGSGTSNLRLTIADTATTSTNPIAINTTGVVGNLNEVGFDRPSGSGTTFNIQNSGAGAMTLQVDGSTVWNASNDGSGSGLDADLLDGQDSSTFASGLDNYDLNTLIPSRIESPVWDVPSTVVKRYPDQGADDESTHRMVFINPERASGDTEIRYPFIAPTGCTQVTLTAPAQRPAFAGFAGTLSRAEITDGSDSGVLGTVNLNLTTSAVTTFTTTATVVAGTQYFARIVLNDPTFLVKVGRIRVTCSVGSFTGFSNGFARYDIRPDQLWSNGKSDANNGYYVPSSGSRFIFETTANSFVAESIATSDFGTTPVISDALVIVNGELQTTTISIDQGASVLRQTSYTLPSALNGKLKRVEIVMGSRSQSSPGTGSVQTATIRAVYVDALAHTIVRGPVDDKPRVLVIADSILTGTGSTEADMRGSVALALRRYAPQYNWFFDGMWAGNSMKEISQNLPTYLTQWKSIRPDIVVIQVGTNDYGGNTMTAAAFGAAYRTTVNAIRKMFPGVVVQLMTPTLRTTETANGSGNTTDDYRTQISNVATALGLPTVLNGKTMITSDDLADGVHLSNQTAANPVSAGHEKVARAIWQSVIGLALPTTSPGVSSAVLAVSATSTNASLAAILTTPLDVGTYHCTARGNATDTVGADGAQFRLNTSGLTASSASQSSGQLFSGPTVPAITDVQATSSGNSTTLGTGLSFGGGFFAFDATLVVTVAGSLTIDFAQAVHTTGTATTAAGAFLRCEGF